MWALLVQLAPVLARIAMLLLDKAGADAKEKQEFLDMIAAAQDDSLAPQQIKDNFNDLHRRLKEKMTKTPPVEPNPPA